MWTEGKQKVLTHPQIWNMFFFLPHFPGSVFICIHEILAVHIFHHFSTESKSEALCQQPPRPDDPEVLCADHAWRDGTFGWIGMTSVIFLGINRTSPIFCKIIEYHICIYIYNYICIIYVYSVIMLWIRFFDQWICHLVVSALWIAIQSDLTCVDSFIVGARIRVRWSPYPIFEP